MKICLIGSAAEPYTRLAELLSRDHEVTVIRGEETEPSPQLERSAFVAPEHRRSAALMDAIREAFPGQGPDFVEVADRQALGLVPLIARRCADPLLSRVRFAVRLFGTVELEDLHNGVDPAPHPLGDLEREQLRLADRLLYSGGDGAALYRRYYGEPLPDALELALPGLPADPVAPRPAPAGELRILYNGELSRRAGVLDLAEACLRLPVDTWSLTLVGPDTETAPAGQSVRLTIEAMFGGDPRLAVVEGEDTGELDWGSYDLAAVTPTLAVRSQTALEAMRHGLPLLATPVGQLPALVEPGVTGWLTEGIGPEAIQRGLLGLLERPERVGEVSDSGAIASRYEELSAPERARAGYERLFESEDGARPARRSVPAAEPLVTAVVPHHRTAAYVEEAVASMLGQTHRNVEVVVVNDGSFEPADAVLEDLAADSRVRVITQPHSGETTARNRGVRMARGEYVVMLDSDNVLEPEFVTRALAVFEREPGLAYVSCWLRFIGPDGSPNPDPAGYAPLGNRVVSDDVENWDGDTLAMIPRRLFAELDLGFEEPAVVYSDWEFYRALRAAGRFGAVIPEWLARYRFLASSLQHSQSLAMQRHGWNEARARRAMRATRWTAGGDGG